MKLKRVLVILLCVSLLIITVAGCRSTDDDDYQYENGTETPPGSTPAPSSGDGDPLEEAEEILRLLNERIGSDDFVEFFREMMFEHSEDPGRHSFPDGYIFREGEMVSEFFETTISLEIGGISGIVETMYGYHIILRLPIDFDSFSVSHPSGGPPSSVRQLAAMEDFEFQRFQWLNALEIEYSQEYEDLDFAVVFENGLDFDASFATLDPDTIMISSGDLSISWAQLYVFIYRIVYEVFQMHEAGDMEIDWNEEAFEERTWAELVLGYASEEAISFISYMYGMERNNIVLSDDDLQDLNESIESIIEMYGSKEELEYSLRETSGYYNFDVFMDLVTIEFGVSVLVDTLYGDEGSEFPDSLVEIYAEANGFLMAMHILRMKPGF